MKKLYLLFIFSSIFLVCSSCAPGKPLIIPKEKHAYGVNFTNFSDKNFLFTPYKYEGKYESVGLVRFEIKSGAEYIPNKELNWLQGDWEFDYATSDEILNYAHDIAIKMGADAICDFKIIYKSEEVIYDTQHITLPIVEVSGFAIKRMD